MNKDRLSCLRDGCPRHGNDDKSCPTCLGAWCSIECARKDTKAHQASHVPYFKDNISDRLDSCNKASQLIYEDSSGRVQVGIATVREEIPWEVHKTITQTTIVVSGTGQALIQKQRTSDEYVPPMYEQSLEPGDIIVIPSGTRHKIVNTGLSPLKIYNTYSKDSSDKGWNH